MKTMRTFLVFSLFIFTFSLLFAAPAPVPKEALKAFQVAKGKPCKTGVVFMDGQYIPPPYVVKRYGTAIMINDVQVTAPLVAWEEFLKTQSGVQVTRTETPAAESAAPSPAAEPIVVEPEEEPEDDPLADLFDDDPKPAKKKPAAKKRPVVRRAPPKPTVTTTYAMEGDFVPNEASRALLEKINRYRTDVNARLLNGGFVFFGSNYARVSGESRETKHLLETLPVLMRENTDAAQLYASLRRNNFLYLTEPIAADLVRNRHQYPQLEARARRLAEEAKFDDLMRGNVR